MATYGKKNPKFKTDGYEIHYGLRIKKTKNNRPYEVVLPKAPEQRSPTRRTFNTKDEAKAFAYKSSIEIENKGRSSLTFTDEMRLDAEQALKILKPYKVNLATAATHYAKHNAEINETNLTSALIDQYIQHREYLFYDMKEGRERTLQDIKKDLPKFKTAFGKCNINLITATQIDEWLDSLNGIANRERIRRYLSTFFTYCMKKEIIQKNPIKYLRTRNKPKATVAIYSYKEAQLILECADETIRPYIALGFFAGLRPKERMRLSWRDIDLNNKTITVENDTSKTGDFRILDMTENLYAILSNAKSNTDAFELTQAQVNKRRRSAYKKANVKHIQDGERKTFASHYMAKYGIDETRLRMGHNTTKTLWDYYISLRKSLKKDAEVFFKIGLPKAQKVIPIKSAIKAS